MGIHVTHTTIMRRVLHYVPEYKKRRSLRAKPTGSSWRVDETFILMHPKMGYLYRAMDRDGKTVDSLFQTSRRVAAGMAFFRKAVATSGSRWPRKITMDGHRASHAGLGRLRREDHRWKYVGVRNEAVPEQQGGAGSSGDQRPLSIGAGIQVLSDRRPHIGGS